MASAPPATELDNEATPPVDNDTAFADAFAAAASDEPPAEAPAPEAPAPEAPSPETPAPETPAPEAPAPEAPAPEAPAPEAPEPSAPASADDIVKSLADMLTSRGAETPAPETPAPAPEPVALYEEAELAVLTEYEKNWPDVSAAETLKRRAEYHDMMTFMFTEMQKVTNPLAEQVRMMTNNLHMGELKAQVPDYSDTLETDVNKWIEDQPNYLQAPMKQVMQTGTSDEVADLIGRYRGSTGAAPASAAPAAPAVAAPKTPSKTELSSAAKQAAESLAPVSSDRTQIPAGEDSSDFKSAFDRYAAELMKE